MTKIRVKDGDGAKALLTVVVLFFLTPVAALLTAKVYSITWGLLLAPQYGQGPTYQSWYGIACFTTLFTARLAKSQSEPDESIAWTVVRDIIGAYIGMAVVIGIAAFVRVVVGWP